MDAGDLVSDDLVIGMVDDRISPKMRPAASSSTGSPAPWPRRRPWMPARAGPRGDPSGTR